MNRFARCAAFVAVMVHAARCTAVAADTPELRWGEFGFLSKWDRYPYAIKSDYEFMGRLPDLTEFPHLLELALSPQSDPKERGIIVSQMITLSRCDFFEETLGIPEKEVDYRKGIEKWREWWNRYGSKLAESLPKTGKRYPEAWRAVAPSPYLEGPKYPIEIPQTWSTTISFRSGDYGGVTEEVIDFQVAGDACTLTRKYCTGWMGASPWKHETWKGFSRKEADLFFAAVVYAIDNPWFYLKDELWEQVDKDDKKNPLSLSHILGRPKEWSSYYPGVKWTGFLDAGGKVMMNDDAWNWDSLEPGSMDTSLGSVFGVVFRVYLDMFPDPSYDPDVSKWTKVVPKAPEAAAKPKE